MIRNFIYLDSDKLRSFSSQLFEGVTEQVVSHSLDSETHQEDQRGPVGSGRILADIFAQERSSSELKFLEDHAYTLFEAKLVELSLLASLTPETNITNLDKSFVKASSRLQLNDLAASVRMLKQFNEMGEAFWRVTNESMAVVGPDGPTKISNDNEAKRKAGELGMQMHKKVADSAAFLIDMNFQNLFEVNMSVGDTLISAPLKREFLREDERTIVHKYSRVTSMDFTLLGLITQNGSARPHAEDIPDVKDAANLKTAMRSVTLHMRSLEDSFGAPLANEIVVDPIAIFSDV